MGKVHAGFQALAEAAAGDLSHSDIRAGLQDCLSDGDGGYICDIYGDGESGDVVYYSGGQYQKAPYSMGMLGGKRTHSIDTENATNVLPRTVYDEEADDDDQYVNSMESALASGDLIERFPGSQEQKRWTFTERFISKKTRGSADASDFAGNYDGSPNKKSFPILAAKDVSAAVRSIGRGVAGGHSAVKLKNRITAIAKSKGFEGSLPDAWGAADDGDAKECLIEFRLSGIDAELKEAAEYPVKLMSPGRGSSGYYPEDVVKRDGPKIFKKDTQMFWNHATEAEEADRPEGSLNNLAAVLTSDAKYKELGPDGPGLYANAKVFGDYVDKVKEMGKHIGLSIRAGGTRDDMAKGPDGRPGVITALKQAQSVDFVTKAGRDGKILFTEAARGASEGEEMDEATIQRVVEAAVTKAVAPLQAENKKLSEALATQKAPEIVHKALAELRLPAPSKKKLFEHFTSENALAVMPMKEGRLDGEAIGKMVEAAAVREAQFLMDLGYGDSIPSIGQRVDPKDVKESGKQSEKAYKEAMKDLADVFVPTLSKASRKAFKEGRVAA